ncbi:MAG TPA: HAMP domain-containing histidine kinase, partial [Leptolyngbyaceae cyanobacterium M65_K2018_010]|nr:HAMP domain-containing histidine kinase [Leptolyngbyaceae cyanobacterium M65_K2018_010]
SPDWSREERQQAEQVANTVALAWVLDQRGQWLQQQLQQRHLIQAHQSETFHDLLHQFRNPLTALQTFGRLLVKRIPADDPNQPIAEGIVRESRRLQDLTTTFDQAVAQGDDLLQASSGVPPVARLLLPGAEDPPPVEWSEGSGATANRPTQDFPRPLQPGQGDLHALGRSLEVRAGSLVGVVAPLLQTAAAIAQERGLSIVQTLPPDLPPVWMDPAALEEVLTNLLDNALKYAPSGSLLWVTGGLTKTLQGERLQGLAIGDTGMGIPLADQPHIFDRHFRGVQAQGGIAGTGLGLAIAQDLVQAMGGHIELVSPVTLEPWVPGADPGVKRGPGTLFIVWLPTV